MNRREMLIGCAALPLVGLIPQVGLAQQENPRIVKFTDFRGPGRKNQIDEAWADNLIDNYGTDYLIISNGRYYNDILRYAVENCFLLEIHSNWFNGTKLNQNYIWHGDVRLIKDIYHLKRGGSKVKYYLCRGEKAIPTRLAHAFDKPNYWMKDWQ